MVNLKVISFLYLVGRLDIPICDFSSIVSDAKFVPSREMFTLELISVNAICVNHLMCSNIVSYATLG